LVGYRLGHLVTSDDGDTGIRTESVKVGATARPGISDVRQVGVSDVAIGGARRTVPSAILAPKPTGVVPGCRGDHVLHARVATGSSVAEMRRRAHGLGG